MYTNPFNLHITVYTAMSYITDEGIWLIAVKSNLPRNNQIVHDRFEI